MTGKNILPISVDETVTEKLYRKNPHDEKTIVKGINSTGVNELFNTGDMLSTVLKDVFQDINVIRTASVSFSTRSIVRFRMRVSISISITS